MPDYRIAGQLLRLEGAALAPEEAGLGGFAPFRSDEPHHAADVTVQLADPLADWRSEPDVTLLHTFPFEDEQAECFFGASREEWLFAMERPDGQPPVLLRGKRDSGRFACNTGEGGDVNRSLYRFTLWMAFALGILRSRALPIHASVVVFRGEALLFLGESGTGKSTHTRLWRAHIEGARLLNDDSPILHVDPTGRPVVSGSPWSGKTPCYVPRTFPIRGIVRLAQAPCNRIWRLNAIQALGALLPSCPPALSYDDGLQDDVCALLSEVIARVPVYRLECLPDEAAARLSCSTLYPEP